MTDKFNYLSLNPKVLLTAMGQHASDGIYMEIFNEDGSPAEDVVMSDQEVAGNLVKLLECIKHLEMRNALRIAELLNEALEQTALTSMSNVQHHAHHIPRGHPASSEVVLEGLNSYFEDHHPRLGESREPTDTSLDRFFVVGKKPN